MAALAGARPGDVVFDVHSHTNVSHDVRGTLMGGFDTEANLRWHRRAGFDAVFVTDHNTVAGLRPHTGPPALCPGIEVSAWSAHVVLLGDSVAVDREAVQRLARRALAAAPRQRLDLRRAQRAVAPRVRRNHWGRLDTLVAAGADGFEIVNAAPKANEFSRSQSGFGGRARPPDEPVRRRRERQPRLGRDQHGVEPHARARRSPGGSAVCTGATPGASTGVRHRPGSSSGIICGRTRTGREWLTPVGVLWETWRGMDWPLTTAWLVWIWLLWAYLPAVWLAGAKQRIVVPRGRNCHPAGQNCHPERSEDLAWVSRTAAARSGKEDPSFRSGWLGQSLG